MIDPAPARSDPVRAQRRRAHALLGTVSMLAVSLLLPSCGPPSAPTADARTPEQVVDAFYAALQAGDAARALSLLASDTVVFEMGSIDRSRRDYASVHLPTDMDLASRTRRDLLSRQSGSVGDARWVASVYKETTFGGKSGGESADGRAQGKSPATNPITLAETMILRRTGDGWQIAHLHWSIPAAATSPSK